MTAEQSVEYELFRGREPSAADSEALLAQYRLLVETSEALVVRRQGVNTFFLSVNLFLRRWACFSEMAR